MDMINDSDVLGQFFGTSDATLDFESPDGVDFFDSLADQMPSFSVDDVAGLSDWNGFTSEASSITEQQAGITMSAVAQPSVVIGNQGHMMFGQGTGTAVAGTNAVLQGSVFHNGLGSNNVIIQQGSLPLTLRNGPVAAMPSANQTQSISGLTSVSGMLVDTGQLQSIGGNTVRLQYITTPGLQSVGVSAAQTIRVVQPQQAYQQVQFVQPQQQTQQLRPVQLMQNGITLIQTANGQIMIQPQQHQQQQQQQQPHVVASRSAQQPIMSTGHSYGVSGTSSLGLGAMHSMQLQMSGATSGTMQSAQQVVLQQPTAVINKAPNIVVQTLPAASGVSMSNFVQVNQLSGGMIQQQHQQPQNIVLPLNTSGMASQQPSEQSGLLVQIGGQTYRMQNVQQLQSVNNVQVVQAPATPRPPVQSAPPISTTPGAQTITLTSSQLTLLQQTPPAKQFGVLQQLLRQQQQQKATHGVASTMQVMSAGAGCTTGNAAVQTLVVSSTAQPSRTPLFTTGTPPRPASQQVILRASPSAATPVRIVQRPSIAPMSGVLHTIRPKPATSELTPMSSLHSGGIVGTSLRTNAPMVVNVNAQPLNRASTSTVSSCQSVLPSVAIRQVASSQGTPCAVRPMSVIGARPAAQVAAVTFPVAHSVATSTVTTAVTHPVATPVVSAASAMHLTAQQQTLLVRVQNQVRMLTNNTRRTPEQDRFLQLLLNAQQQILTQGRAQLQASQSTGLTSNGAITVTATSSLVTIPQTLQNTVSVPGGSIKLATASQVKGGFTLPASASVVTVAIKPTVLPAATGSASTTSSTSSAATPSTMEQLYSTFPHLREKLEAQLAKMPPERREWFMRNQTAIFTKLQQHQLMLQQQRVAAASTTQHTLTETAKPAVDIKLSTVRLPLSAPGAVIVNGSVNLPTRLINTPAFRASRKQRFQMQLIKEQKHATEPDYKTPFVDHKDILRRLVVYHVYQTREDDPGVVDTAEAAYEQQTQQLLDRKDAMLTKYRRLLLQEAMRLESTANDVMLGRMFLNDERMLLKEEMRLAAEDPESFVPRPVLQPAKDEEPDDSKMDVVKTDFKVEDEEEKTGSGSDRTDDVKPVLKLECDSEPLDTDEMSAEPDDGVGVVPSYTVRNSGRLTFVFKSSPLHVNSPAHSPPPTTKSDSLRDIRVKLERCDDDVPPSSPKRCRVDDLYPDTTAPLPEHQVLSEDDAAVAGLLSCTGRSISFEPSVDYASHMADFAFGTDEYCDTQNEFYSDVGEQIEYVSADGADLNGVSTELFSGFGHDDVPGFSGNEAQHSTGELSAAVSTLMADLNDFSSDDSDRSRLNYTSSSSTKRSVNLGRTELSESSLQEEMQFAIDSILGMQQ